MSQDGRYKNFSCRQRLVHNPNYPEPESKSSSTNSTHPPSTTLTSLSTSISSGGSGGGGSTTIQDTDGSCSNAAVGRSVGNLIITNNSNHSHPSSSFPSSTSHPPPVPFSSSVATFVGATVTSSHHPHSGNNQNNLNHSNGGSSGRETAGHLPPSSSFPHSVSSSAPPFSSLNNHHQPHHSTHHNSPPSLPPPPPSSSQNHAMAEPTGHHRLQYRYNLWFSKRAPGKLASTQSYDQTLKLLATFGTVEQFWSVYSYLIRPAELPGHFDFHLFKEGIKPMWEHEANQRGGKWVIRLKKGISSRCWENLVLAILGKNFDTRTHTRFQRTPFFETDQIQFHRFPIQANNSC